MKPDWAQTLIKTICYDQSHNLFDLCHLFSAYLNNHFDQYNQLQMELIRYYLKEVVEKENLFIKGEGQQVGYEALFILISGITTIAGNPQFLTQLNNSDLENLKNAYFALLNQNGKAILKERMRFCKYFADDEATIIRVLQLEDLDLTTKLLYLYKNLKGSKQGLSLQLIKVIDQMVLKLNY